jgi:N-acyl-D-aspartate/D-glutamate deacylase
MEYDVLIKGGLIVDGTGAPAYTGDVAIKGDRLAAIGPNLGRDAARIIEADGLVVTPGFIDPLTHYDAQLLWDNLATPSSSFGITTIVIGNCGFAIAPCKPKDREMTMRALVKVEGMSLKALQEGIPWEFETYPEYLQALERHHPALNVATLIGHSPLRVYAMGEAASERAANEEERQTIKRLFVEALEAGAFGLGTSTSTVHIDANGRPVPSRMASQDEFDDLIEVFRRFGRGTFEITPTQDGKSDWMADFGRRSGRPVTWALLMSSTLSPNRHRRILSDTERFQSEGIQLYPQTGCFPLTMDFSLESPYPFEGLPVWQRVFNTPRPEWPALFQNPEFRDTFRQEATTYPTRLFPGQWELVEVLEPARPENEPLRGKNMVQLAQERGASPVDTFFDLAVSEDLQTMFNVALLNTDEGMVHELISNPATLIAASDAGAHQTLLCDAGYTARMLGYWVRDKGLLQLEQAVASLTTAPARVYGIKERGRLTPGYYADVVIYDPKTIMDGPKRLVRDLPGGEPRLTRDSQGILFTFVNGQPLMNEGKIDPQVAAERPNGQVLRAS